MIMPIARLLRYSIWGILLSSLPLSSFAANWPQEITEPQGKVVVYQLQPDSLSGNMLQGKAVISITLAGKKPPIFGAFWFIAKIDTGTDTAQVSDVDVTQIKWPKSTTDTSMLNRIVNNAFKTTTFNLSMKNIRSSLASAKQERNSLKDLKNTAPNIIFKQQLTVLLSYDGAPLYRAIDDSQYERVINTPFAVARNKKTKTLYLSNGSFWYEARDPLGPWKLTRKPPANLVKLLPKPNKTASTSGTPPRIYASTTPTELISTQGQPQWKSLITGQLLYVTNTEVPWIRDTATSKMYLLLSGRWFSATKETGPWTFVRSDRLPKSFSNIPPNSAIGGVRVSIAGTKEANEAVLNANIPQTAAIKRHGTTTKVIYNGKPQFKKIAGTQVAYAVNTASQVLKINKQYYVVDNGVWFVAARATGPWVVADHIPNKKIALIPPSSPVYNVTYVHIYDSTPNVVYVGYTSGYLWSYIYYGVPVYGTGWYYSPFWGPYYYPRPFTWGFYVGYNPWFGWNYGFPWDYGFYNAGFAWGGGYSPWDHHWRWYRPATLINHSRVPMSNINIHAQHINIANNVNVGNRIKINHSMKRKSITQSNIYNNVQNRIRNADSSMLSRTLQQAIHSPIQSNSIPLDKQGNVIRNGNAQIKVREHQQWKNINTAPMDNIQSTEPMDNIQNTEPMDNIQRTEPMDNIQSTEPMDNIQNSMPMDNIQNSMPMDNIQNSMPMDNIQNSMPMDNIQNSMPMENIQNSMPMENSMPMNSTQMNISH